MTSDTDPLWRNLGSLRGELDRIDDQVHDLLSQRAAVVRGVAALRAQGKVALRPGREASIITRLLGRNHGALPPSAIPRIWREILASSLAMQTDFAVAAQNSELVSLAREHFGALTPVQEFASTEAALAAVRSGAASVALLPWPGPLDPVLLANLFVVARLPFWTPRPAHTPQGEALVIASTPPDPSGNDCSLISIGGQIEEIEGFLTTEDPRMVALGFDAVLLGAYAVPVSGEPE